MSRHASTPPLDNGLSTPIETWAQSLPAEWRMVLEQPGPAQALERINAFVEQARQAGAVVYPSDPFKALRGLGPADVRVVIIGQDPYHGPGQAHGLAFSVRPGVRVPPSLVNIYKELQSDLGIARARHGFLEHWARQGVLLLNTSLTVEQGLAASHKGRGWETFTDAVIGLVAEREQPCAFLLWGSHAQKKAGFVDASRHLVLKAPHPSPLSAHNGFFGCRHFSRTNVWLESQGLHPIDWTLPPV